ncbi:TetR/AcrR family transcriptional regulator [Falsirhodobacter sp. alg1]|uniref:TetR/AcrR family transcriptional regulator n=1 Tax=Falsirhodobacter sp. alg1 TaxID=1472418 RepID=UPI00078760E9|nr:TetR/AcrR family transcriptional regulator [Falsirhodobacter sp. alg1]
MSRPARYDREKALDAAMGVFWSKGYHATSLKDLEGALGMKPGSIYGAFSSKENLCLLSLQRYFEASIARFHAHMAKAATPLTGLAEYLCGFAELEPDDRARQMCMLARTLMDTNTTEAGIAAQSRLYLETIREAFTSVFERAKAGGELPAHADCGRLARRFQANISAIRFEMHLGTPQNEITALARDMAGELKALRTLNA